MKRVFLSGAGMVTSLGTSLEETWQGLLEGKSGVRYMEDWKSLKGLSSHLGAPAPDVDIRSIPRTVRRTMSRMSQLMVHSTLDALAKANLDLKTIDPTRVAIIMGSTTGSPQTYKEYFFKAYEVGGPEGQLGTSFFKVMNHSVASNVASALDFCGPVLAPSSACSTSSQAMVMGWEYIKSGLYDIVIAGGADELHHTSCEVFDIVFAASKKYNDTPQMSPRPFDKDRDGLVVSEGAGVVVMESADSMRARGVAALGEVLGGAFGCSGAHMSKSDTEAMMGIIRQSISRAASENEKPRYVNAHATGTFQGDQAEVEAIHGVLGSETYVSSLKGHLGHSLAPCGAIEAALSCKMMNEGLILPTRNLVEVSPECDLVQHVKEPLPVVFSTAVSTNFAFGGFNTSLFLGRSPDC
ncbi:MAG: beta-ketoacyl-[acyl-carrier-protein] synthase family protein [Bdellovibrionota bacterium]